MAELVSTSSSSDNGEYNISLNNDQYPSQLGRGDPSTLRNLSFAISMVGILGNVTFLIVVARHKSMQNVINVYLANLAVADIMVLALGSFGILTNIFSYLPPNILGCSFVVVVTTPYYVNIAIVSLLTLDRYYAVRYPVQYRVVCSKKRSAMKVAAAWCVSVLYSCLVNVESSFKTNRCQMIGSQKSPTFNTATDEHFEAFVFSDILKPLPFILLLFSSSFMYAGMVKVLSEQAQFRKGLQMASSPVAHRSNSRTRMNRMIAVNTFVLILCNTPRTVLVTINFIKGAMGEELFEHPAVTVISTTALLLNSCVNPLIYNLTNKTYRRAFLEVFFTCGRQNRNVAKKSSSVFHLSSK